MSLTNVSDCVAELPATSYPVTTYPLGVEGAEVHEKVLEAKLGPVVVVSAECVQPAVAMSG